MIRLLASIGCFFLAVHAGLSSGQDRAAEIGTLVRDASAGGVLVVAHRGHHADAPENSIESIHHAIDIGAHIVEIDIRRTADGVLVLMHDKTIDRTTTGEGAIAEMTLAEAREVQLLDGLRPTASRIPTLDEAFEAARGKILLNLDPKALTMAEAFAAAEIAGMLDHLVLKQRWERLSAEDAELMRSLNDRVIFMPIVRTREDALAALEFAPWPVLEAIADDASSPFMDPALVAQLRSRGTRVWINTLWNGRLAAGLGDEQAAIDPDSVFGRVAELGFGIVQTDLPEIALEILRAVADNEPPGSGKVRESSGLRVLPAGG